MVSLAGQGVGLGPAWLDCVTGDGAGQWPGRPRQPVGLGCAAGADVVDATTGAGDGLNVGVGELAGLGLSVGDVVPAGVVSTTDAAGVGVAGPVFAWASRDADTARAAVPAAAPATVNQVRFISTPRFTTTVRRTCNA